MHLTENDRAVLSGEAGAADAEAMDLVLKVGEAMGAASLIDITGAHVDSCLYHGLVSLEFAERLTVGGGKVAVPTTLNVASLDLLHPELVRRDPETSQRAKALMDAFVAMGCEPTWTCAPYQLRQRPQKGDQIAWGESNAIVFANSVLGARTNRYGDFLDICCALIGRAPAVGLHTDEGRRATVRIDVTVPDQWLDDDVFYVAVGHFLGQEVGTDVAVLSGLDDRVNEDRLKALGATAASAGAVGLFHVAGVTPEARTVDEACQGARPNRFIDLDEASIQRAIKELSSTTTRLGAVSVGTPHASLREIEQLAALVAGRETRVPFYVNTGRGVLAEAEQAGLVESIESFGARFVTDTCTYITPIMEKPDGAVMTNSGKWAYYAPGNLGFDVVLAGLTDCVESAVSGRVAVRGLN